MFTFMRHRILLAFLAFLALFTAVAVPQDVWAEDEVNFDYFYSALQDQGDWFGTDTYGYVFQPRAAAKDPNWRPYADGYWSYTDEGWTWISYEDFGWATYHYGRWAKLASIGWVWVPGYEWAPAWVSWRTSSAYGDDTADGSDQPTDPDADVIGWAPLPPNAVLYPGPGLVGGLDYIYDIPPENYCFVPAPYFCAPALIVVIFVPARNYHCFGWTINVTHCHFRDHRGVPRIFAGGPNFDRLQRRVPRPIPRFTIERRAGVPTAGRGAPAILNQVRGGTLEVIAPRIAPPPGVASSSVGVPRTASTQRPAQIKAVIAKATPVAGWNTPGVPTQTVQAARDQLKREAAQAPRQAVAAAVPTRPVLTDPPGPPVRAARANPSVGTPNSVAPESPQDAFRRQQAEDRERRQQIIAEQRRASEEASPQNESPEAQMAQRQQQIEAQQRSQSEAQARMRAMRQQQVEQARQAQANSQAQRQQQVDTQRQVQAERQRRAQAEAQARAEAQREATRQLQQQAEQQRRAAEAQRRMEAARNGAQGAQGTQTP